MGREIKLYTHSLEIFSCGVCKNICDDFYECYDCQGLFCFQCVSENGHASPTGNCPLGCPNSRFELISPLLARIIREIHIKCKWHSCIQEHTLKDIGYHESSCKHRPDIMDIEKHDKYFDKYGEEIRVKRDAEWLQMLRDSWGRGYPVMVPVTPTGCMPYYPGGYPPMPPTPSSISSGFVFPCPTPRSHNFQL